MKLRVNAELFEYQCEKCEQLAYARKNTELTCSNCKKKMQPGVLFSGSLVRFTPVIYNVNKD